MDMHSIKDAARIQKRFTNGEEISIDELADLYNFHSGIRTFCREADIPIPDFFVAFKQKLIDEVNKREKELIPKDAQ